MKLHQQRTCMGCRITTSKNELIRWVVQPGQPQLQVRLDATGQAHGRGAWTHPVPKCVQQAVHRKGFARAFRAQVDASAVLQDFEAYEDRTAPDRRTGRDKESGSEI
ncbi:YlxR family protein [Glutamicibacter sp. MNS18]|uniref:YlxR family protein n=1 Tax=Glutamicibacter sp. MNS18 TaxID=2989817 RepID=UPI0022367477|nr:YlxR family protein [Glutamicibacter sp. MNS18]MCW4465268.1 YlxR family protein [Glutamicibacter sp. MNS18]